jgi:5-methyltetrahydropteroyltriglutamate--homocysteine methyltransferase
MKNSARRIRTTHVGSLPRPAELLELIQARELGKPYEEKVLAGKIRSAVAEIVRQQIDAGVDVVSDGELGKTGFFTYVGQRLNGMEILEGQTHLNMDVDFPEFQAWRTARGRSLVRRFPVCTGPLSWRDGGAVTADLENLKSAISGMDVEAFLPAASPGIIAQRMANRYYPTYEAYLEAIANLMKDEYRAIVDAGFLLQIDAPELCIDRNQPEFRDQPVEVFRKRVELWVETLNHALQGIPEDRVRAHICWGNSEGPHNRDIPLEQIVDIILKIRAQAYSLEASNPRHAHEWRVWDTTRLPEGKILIPGVVESCTNYVEHPRLVADRLIAYAKRVGRENVIAGTDCGFGSHAASNLVYPPIVWAKLRSVAEGAAIATKELWG